jgi:molybdopterin-containing oxidoreductase family iron-sulfur binding subunit
MVRHAEYTLALEETRDPLARREFLRLMGAALGLAGLGACTRAPDQVIVPYVIQPPEVTPGRPRFYATATTLDGYAVGILVESHEGRPTKVEGNPDHPASLGASGVFDQASVLGLYDPSRARSVKTRDAVSTWTSVSDALRSGPWTEQMGRGLHVLLPPTSSPTIRALLDTLRAHWPRAQVHFHAAVPRTNVWEGSRIAFGRVMEPLLDLTKADVIVSLDADLLASGADHLRLARDFAARRTLRGHGDPMNRLYVVEPVPTATGASADHHLAVRAHDVQAIAAALLAAVGAPAPALARSLVGASQRAAGHERWVRAVAKDLAASRGRSLVIAGDAQPPIVHALAHALNAALGNLGTTVHMVPSPIMEAGARSDGLLPLAQALEAGAVDTLLVIGTNAVYTSPAELRLGALIGRARQSAYLGLYEDETAEACTFSIPAAHALESWGDARAADGTETLVQPLIAPLFGGRTPLDLLALLVGRSDASTHDLVRERFAKDHGKDSKDPAKDPWRRALLRGLVEETAFPREAPELVWSAIAAASSHGQPPPAGADGALELVFSLDPRVHDGRFTNNAWLLELPAPVSKLTWTNAATLSPETAARHGLVTGDEVELRYRGRTVRAPVLVLPGHAAGSVSLTLGWGRRGAEELARGIGTNAYALRTAAEPAMGMGVELTRTNVRHELPITQLHQSLHGRDEDILRHATRAEYAAAQPHDRQHGKRGLSLYQLTPPPAPHQWGMAIDLTICTGCSGCVIACQAENNVPTVGADGVRMGRVMHWLRLDTYFVGDAGAPDVAVQPMLCQHCESAPCEYVCPTNATVHSADGLNQMVYNRCVGTRFCSNNCPYKVRRFNWFDYHHGESPTEQLVHNPDVTVRARGVMEKCTFCVQRIREHEIRSEVDRDRKKRPAPLQTACQQACPTGAIVFGDLQDPRSEVSRLHASDRSYGALSELNTAPRVRYLAKIWNKNPELA